MDRNSDHKRLPLGVTRAIAHELVAHGVASLRFDKRGVGASAGDFKASGFYDNVSDAAAALEFLRSRAEVDAKHVFVIGHSEGALIATQLAGTGASLAGAVLLAGAVQPGEDILRWQARQLAKYLPKPVRLILRLFRMDLARTQAKRFEQIKRSTTDTPRMQLVVKLNAKWFREFLAFDPSEPFRNIQVPVLAITGAKDIQADPADVRRMEAIAETDFEGHVIPDLTHILRMEAGTPSPSNYKKQAKRPMDLSVLNLISEWLERQRSSLSAARIAAADGATAPGTTRSRNGTDS